MSRLPAEQAADRTAPKITREEIRSTQAMICSFIADNAKNYDQRVNYLEQVRAVCTLALQAEAMQPRPMNTAPKDGTEILLYGRNWHCVAKWVKWAEQWRDATSCNYELKGAIAWLPLTSLPEPRNE